MDRRFVREGCISLGFFCTLVMGVLASSACGSSKNGQASTCVTGDEKCACYSNHTCNEGLVCLSDVCVVPSNTSTGGASSVADTTLGGNTQVSTGGLSSQASSGGAPSTGGATQAMGGSPSTGGATQVSTVAPSTGGVPQTGATGGAPATGGASVIVASGGAQPAGGNAATGGAAPGATGGAVTTGGALATGGATQAATGGASSVNNSPVIDAFASCDNKIESNGGRSGEWYSFADSDLNATHGYGDPGTKWVDHGCAAWIVLGCTDTACNYGGIGVQLAKGDPYDLSRYQGVSVAFEGGDDVYFVVKTSNGGYFGAWLAGTSGTQTRNAYFDELAEMSDSAVSTLNPALITEIQFTIGKSLALDEGAGFAIHAVTLF